MTMTLPIQNPGALETLFSTSAAPSGMRAMRRRAALRSSGLIRSSSSAIARGSSLDGHAERLGHRVGGDVVVGRADAAGGEDVGVARPQRVQRGDDLGLVVGHDADLGQIDAEFGATVGDRADVAVLGAPGQDLVADHEDGGGDGFAHETIRPAAARRRRRAARRLPRPAVRRAPSRAAGSAPPQPVHRAVPCRSVRPGWSPLSPRGLVPSR